MIDSEELQNLEPGSWSEEESNDRIIRVRTSDRSAYRGCRRKWHWVSAMRSNLTTYEIPEPFWLGTGLHFALEDFHGYKKFATAAKAFKAYEKACVKCPSTQIPDTHGELSELCIAMLDYYTESWLSTRSELKTLWVNGEPQVEVRFEIPIPIEHPDYDLILYDGTIDRVVINDEGLLWLVDYKTAQAFQHTHTLTDSQVSAYCWAGNVLYDQPVQGLLYQQHKKQTAKSPRILANGLISSNKSQATTYALYKESLINLYTQVSKAPQPNIDTLNYLASAEDTDWDKFVRRDWILRNKYQQAAEGEKILMEVDEMLNPNLALYPNPNMFCGNCGFLSPCISIDDGSDWEYDLKETAHLNTEKRDPWRDYISWPRKRRKKNG